MFRQIGPTEILLILGVVLLLFGGRKLPELARGSGRALRIFKSEVSELQSDDDAKGGGKKSREDVDTARLEAADDADAPSTSPTARDTRPDQA